MLNKYCFALHWTEWGIVTGLYADKRCLALAASELWRQLKTKTSKVSESVGGGGKHEHRGAGQEQQYDVQLVVRTLVAGIRTVGRPNVQL